LAAVWQSNEYTRTIKLQCNPGPHPKTVDSEPPIGVPFDVCPHHSVRKIFDCGVEEGGIDMVPSGKEPMVLAETDGKKKIAKKPR
jgi:hypothetical protein